MSRVEIRLLGPVQVLRDGELVALPRSRKVRALLALLALEKQPQSRSRLCDLLWDAPNDPRGELRWCLSKLRGVLDTEGAAVVVANSETVTLDRSACTIDALVVEDAGKNLESADTAQLTALVSHITGEFLDGMQLDGTGLDAWLLATRQRMRALHVAILRELARRAPVGSDAARERIEAWLRRAPHDIAGHQTMLEALASRQLRDAEEHFNIAIRSLEQEGIDWEPLRQTYQRLRSAAAPSSVLITSPPMPPPVLDLNVSMTMRRGSVAVMPFVASSDTARGIADGVTDDVITRLAKLRLLFVIARGTTYALRDRGVDPREAGRILDVQYIVNGTVRREPTRLVVGVELSDTQTGGIVWSEQIESAIEDPFSVLDWVVNRIVSAVADEIERAEVRHAIVKPPSSLDAWEAYHRGLWHMYKFTGADNDKSAQFFREALRLDPMFSRAHAGLSFTHFQNVFLELTPDREKQIELALETANASISSDERDPAAHWAMGRALWLRGEQRESVAELERSVDLSPNFALGHYTLGFVQSQQGDPEHAIDSTEYSRQLSPFDPLTFAMLATRALAHMRLGEREQAADWASRAVTRPNAHVHILSIAATNLALANRRDQANAIVARIRERVPGYNIDMMIRAFRLLPDTEKLLREAARTINLG